MMTNLSGVRSSGSSGVRKFKGAKDWEANIWQEPWRVTVWIVRPHKLTTQLRTSDS